MSNWTRAVFFAVLLGHVGGGFWSICPYGIFPWLWKTPERCAEPRGMRNLDIAKLTGVWYEITFVIDPPVAPELIFTDFYLDIQQNEDGTLSIKMEGRPQNANHTDCTTVSGFERLVPTARSGEYAFIFQNESSGDITFDEHIGVPLEDAESNVYMILDTDYTHYLVNRFCLGKQADGLCSKEESFLIYSRRPTLAPVFLKKAKKLITKDLCNSPKGFVIVEHSKACA
ncbi:uncharacterized protein LOC106154063 [Lingula anatina]|uniref:Uncharacterized protein LOC106154063 n=1 Tax=Lingula anatina TaxID=7574 RepID=A0A1S3HE20_LINAN|nr:uncharacterized protein LOC106154063 [Lingula anatina]XP_013383751.1 uncharacterized protein LOC106154063 [Lingula anatina]XP_013383752.1 uncharacterized protein LOC106154063 [Lingula anatina]|eukprot:XP_013383750.1 uncharacterized protein LOC106154063 [Lingula anatina]